MRDNMTENNKPDKSELVQMAYGMGYQCYEHTFSEYADMLQESDNPEELWLNGNDDTYPICDMARGSCGKNSYQRMIWNIENKLGFNSEKEDWDNAGIYGIIEDCSVSWESGAFDALMDKDYNPERLPFIED